MRKYYNATLLVLIWVISVACSDFQKVMKSDSIEEKYAAALAYYEKKDYFRAGLLLEELIPIMKGRADAEKAQFLYAYSHFGQKQYLLASYYFKNLYETYPRSEYAEESRFMYAKSLFYDSPKYNLDQGSTISAMDAFQTFIVNSPESRFARQADSLYNVLGTKVEYKAYENAKLYYNLRHYKSAVVSLGNFVHDFPASKYAEEVAFLRIDAQFEFARQSVPEKQRERFDEVVDFYLKFIDKYPQSALLKAAENRYAQASAQLQKLKISTL